MTPRATRKGGSGPAPWPTTIASAAARSIASIATAHVEMVLSDFTIANGLGWSPDGATMYLADSHPRVIHAFDFDADRGTVSGGRVSGQLGREIGAPDGLTVDAAGDLWVAVYGGGCVHRYSPDGALRETFDGPSRAEHLVRVRRPGASPLVRHHRDRELERRAASRRARGRDRLPVRHRRDRAPGITVPTRSNLVEGNHRMNMSRVRRKRR